MNMKLINEFKALADKTRLRIISLLSDKSLCVCEIMDVLEMTQSRISRHLGILKQAGFIEEERRGKWVVYKIIDNQSILLSYINQEIKDDHVYISDMKKIKETLEKKMCPLK